MSEVSGVHSHPGRHEHNQRKAKADEGFSVQGRGDGSSRQKKRKGSDYKTSSYRLTISPEAIEASQRYAEQRNSVADSD